MANLTIDSATVGYDTAGVNSLMHKIQAEVIQDAKDALTNKLANLFTAVDEIWKGRSAEQFKENMQQDMLKISSALDNTYNSLDAEISQIGKAMGNVDDQLVEKRA